jgi:hypothetical protein
MSSYYNEKSGITAICTMTSFDAPFESAAVVWSNKKK